ncbi:hypothetical protein [Yimella sp. cx-51]|uniref:hypothetical protein n=1 Tax=Yimella sp. cx-51 TaxID=2770551 RepID=UPI00165DAB8D|nr:hypothetical protein [Yimella sp. cx-51]MBC9956874.1 hypothetical protein [Yimella sp. cx-51]QTH39099.1 hypothetical protein J5M86_05625 [Yimella sp. cx-51]
MWKISRRITGDRRSRHERHGHQLVHHSAGLNFAALEEILDLAPGSLLDRLGPSRRPGPALDEVSLSALIDLHRPLMVGEMAVVEYELSVPDARGLDHYGQYLLRRVSEALVWVRFHPDAAPPHCEVFQDAGSGEQVTRVHLAGTHEAHHRLSGFGPGFVGVRWSW